MKRGSVKEAYDLGEHLEFRFTDQISVFDKVIPSQIPGKGETLCRESAYWFERAKEMGIHTHFEKFLPPNGILVKKVDIIPPEKIGPNSKNHLIPLEFICRWYVAGSLYDRVKCGDLSPDLLGYSSGHMIEYGEPLPEPFIELTTKLEPVDRLLDEPSALELAGLTSAEYDEIREIVLRIDGDISRNVEKRGLIHVDGKKEFAFDEERKIMVVDVYGTADEDRFWDKERYLEGEFVDLSKEFVRQYYRRIGYKDQLYNSRVTKSPEPDIPPLSESMVRQTSEIYMDLFERITGDKFRQLP